jgi:hypothetical protein
VTFLDGSFQDGSFNDADEGVHPDSACEEFTFTFWSASGNIGGYTSLILAGRHLTYALALVRAGHPLLHVNDESLPPLRSFDDLLVKGEGMWAEHICESPFEQWTVTNETFASALDDPNDAYGRAYGTPTAIAFDLEWYATAGPIEIEGGYAQAGEVHAVIELGTSAIEAVFVGSRTHRWKPFTWSSAPVGEEGLRAPVSLAGEPLNRMLTKQGWQPHYF